MKVKLNVTRLAGGTEVVLDFERGPNPLVEKITELASDLRFEEGRDQRYKAALEAIHRAPDDARAIAGVALDLDE